MKAAWNIFMVLVLIAGAGIVGFFIGHRSASPAAAVDAASSDDDSVKATPVVQTVQIRAGRVDKKIIAYGTVAAQSGDVSVLSVGFESRVKKIDVVAGQRLEAESTVIELEPSPDTQLQMLQAKSAMEAAKQDVEQTKRRFDDHLATNQDLLQSQQNLQLAQLKFDSLKKQGADGSVQLKRAGLVVKVDVQEGQVVPAGGALVEIAGGEKLQVRLGVEPSDAAGIHVGDDVSLQAIRADGAATAGKVRMIAQQINPETRLTDVFVSLSPDAALSLDAFVRGELTVAGPKGLVVPRSAVLPAGEGYSLFIVDQGKAAEHQVSIVGQDDQFTEITGDGLTKGQEVVTAGNLELKDGMPVKASAEPVQAADREQSVQEAAQ